MDKTTEDKKNSALSVTYEDAIKQVGYGKFHHLLTVIGGVALLSSLTASLDITYILPAAECELNLKKEDRGVLAGAVFIGNIISSHLLGFLSDTLGRRYIIIRSMLANIILYILASMSPNYWVLLVLRFLTGIALSGVTSSGIIYVGEFHSNKHRTRAIVLISCFSTIGYIYVAGLGGWILPSEWSIQIFNGYFLSPWRLYYFLVGTIPSVIVGISLIILPESPKYLLACSRKEEALESLKIAYKINSGKPKEQYSVKNLQLDPNEQVSQLSGENKSASAVLKLIWNQTYPLFVPPHLVNMMCSCIVVSSIFFCLASILIWLPDVTNQLLILKDHRPGTSSESVYFCELIQSNWTENIARKELQLLELLNASSAGSKTEINGVKCKPPLKPEMFEITAMIGVVLFISMLVITFIIAKINRKMFVCVTCLLTISIDLGLLYIPNVYIMIFAQGIIIILLNLIFCGINPLLVDYFPTNLRGMALSLAIMTGRFTSALGGHTSSLLLLNNCMTIYFTFPVILCLAALCCICLRSPKKNIPANEVHHATSTDLGLFLLHWSDIWPRVRHPCVQATRLHNTSALQY